MFMMPKSLIDRRDLTLTQRVILPYLVRHTVGWGMRKSGKNAGDIAEDLQLDVRRTIAELESLAEIGILTKGRIKDEKGEWINVFSLAKAILEEGNSARTHAPIESYNADLYDRNAFINIEREAFEDLQLFAFELLDSLNLKKEVFEDYVLMMRSANKKSFDWKADFNLYVKKVGGNTKLPPAKSAMKETIEDYKPGPEFWEMARYFFQKHKEINPKFQEPFNMMNEAKQLKFIVDGTSFDTNDIKAAIDWLFSEKGDWYRPNVPSCYQLKKRFRYIQQHLVSFANKPSVLPDELNIFDITDKLEG